MMKFEPCVLYSVKVEYDDFRERREVLHSLKDISVKIVTRTLNEIDQGFKGNYPKLNGFTLEKEISKGQVIECKGVKYRVIYVDPIPRLTTLYLEVM